MGVKLRNTLAISGLLAAYVGLMAALALPLLGELRPPEDLRLDAVDRRQGRVGQPLALALTGAGFGPETHFTLVLDSGNQQAISRRITTFAGVRTLLRDGTDMYLGTDDRRIWKIDLNRPESPQKQKPRDLNGLPTASLKSGDSLWVASGQGDLARFTANGESRNRIAASLLDLAPGPEDTLLAAAGRQGLLVLRPQAGTAAPRLIATLDVADVALAVASREHLALLGAAKTGLHIYDLSDPAAPRILARIPVTGVPRHIAIQDALALIATHKGLSLVEIGDSGAPVLLSELPLGRITQVEARGDRAYLAAGTAGLLQVDLRDPRRPRLSGHLTPGETISRFILDGDQAILGTAGAELLFADLAGIGKHRQWRPQFSNWPFPIDQVPEAPALAEPELADALTRGPEPASINMLACNASTYYFATDRGLASLPRAGTGRFRLAQQRLTSASQLALANRLLLVAGSIPAAAEGASAPLAPESYGVEIFALDGSGEPRSLALIPSARAVDQLHIRDNRLYLTSTGEGGCIFDLRDPRQPRPLGSFQLPWPEQAFADAQEIVLRGDTLYLANGRAGLQVFDLSDPSAPRRISAHNPPGGRFTKIDAQGDQLFVYDNTGDLQLYDLGDPHQPRLCGVLDRVSIMRTLEVREHKLLFQPTNDSTIARALPLAAEKVDLKSSAQAEIVFAPPVFPGDYRLYAFDHRGRQILADLIRVDEDQK